MNLFWAVVLTGLMHALRSFSLGEQQGSVGASLAFGYLLLTGYFVGGAFKQVGLPRLTGYLVTGIVAGPSLLGMLTADMLTRLKLVNGMAISLIAMTAGTEFEFRAMRPLLRTIRAITVFAMPAAMLLLTAAVLLVQDSLPFMTAMSVEQRIAVAAVLGVVMTAQSPAVVVALRDEMEADGPLSRTVLGVVVVADLVVILAFALASTAARSMFGKHAALLETMGLLAWELFGSLLVGVLIGYVLALYLRKVQGGAELFLLTVAFIIAEVGRRVHLDPLLIALAAGMLIRNATAAGDALHARISHSSLPVYILFFCVAGAALPLDVLVTVGVPAVLFVGVRAISLLLGSYVGARFAHTPPATRGLLGFGLLPQSGLAIALATIFRQAFPEFGEEAAAMVLGVIALNELLAPMAYRFALIRSGEAGTAVRPPAEPEAQKIPSTAE